MKPKEVPEADEEMEPANALMNLLRGIEWLSIANVKVGREMIIKTAFQITVHEASPCLLFFSRPEGSPASRIAGVPP